MEIVGRITKDAVIKQIKDERKVVHFNLVVNDYYKQKNSNEGKRISTFINCTYWLNTKIAKWLTKGSIVEVTGRIYSNAYTNAEGNARASMNCHVNSIKIHSFGKKENFNPNEHLGKVINMQKEEIKEDLPF